MSWTSSTWSAAAENTSASAARRLRRPRPERAVDGGRYSLRFAVKVAFDKYVNHLPRERQVRGMSHYGLDVTSQTLWDQCSAVTELLTPTYDGISSSSEPCSA